jgi:HAD superfamily hydrolase (TIGR01549 family)
VRESLIVGAAAARDAFRLDIDPAAWTEALEHLWASRPVAPGASDLLEGLRARGLPVAIVTNLDMHVLDRVLARTGLGTLVDVAVCSELARAYKPHPRPFQIALGRLGVCPADAVHVGDSPREDVAGAMAAGYGAVRKVEPVGGLALALALALGKR